jgi:RHS repeat-associated protein
MKERIEYHPFGTYRQRTDYDTSFPNVNYTFTEQEDDDELGLYNYKARLYDPALGRFISADTVVQTPGDPQTLNRYSYCRNNPLVYTDPSGHGFWFVLGIIALGAALGATISSISGGNIGLGALTGAISAAAFMLGGQIIMGAGLATVTPAGVVFESTAALIQACGVHFTVGVMSGAVNAAITGGDIGKSAVISGLAAAAGKLAMAGGLPKLPIYQHADKLGKFALEGTTAVATGTVMGGVSAEIMGGDFGQGAAQGAWTSAFGFGFNGVVHSLTAIWSDPEGRPQMDYPRLFTGMAEVGGGLFWGGWVTRGVFTWMQKAAGHQKMPGGLLSDLLHLPHLLGEVLGTPYLAPVASYFFVSGIENIYYSPIPSKPDVSNQ